MNWLMPRGQYIALLSAAILKKIIGLKKEKKVMYTYNKTVGINSRKYLQMVTLGKKAEYVTSRD